MNRVNYQKELDKLLERQEEKRAAGEAAPALFLHSCCAPCSSYVLEYLCSHFRITVFYYNPNISAGEEYVKRAAEEKRLIEAYNGEGKGFPIQITEGEYEPRRFLETVRGLESCPEGGERCFRCYELRLRETARRAAEGGFDYFCTTLSISPLKNAEKLNEIGLRLSEEYGIPWLPSDFKKKNGYKRSVELSAEYGLYRQNYCGCAFSLRCSLERENNSHKFC
ncbi:MAG: epoxyqueuosine reductase QueH [Butyrivibrio sp.]|nr:epoxyqueuosine reductase QueH [Acetatifactor muris]MCM1560719.1 epoxyqueuosine reductase QueH [Butyrivibrio sp.]